MLKKHGFRIDRFVHNYIYFVYYYPYVKAVYRTILRLNHLRLVSPMRPLLRFAYDRYHAKVITPGDAKKILTLNEDVQATSHASIRIIPYFHAKKDTVA